MESFRQILVPVDFSINTEISIAKACALASPDTTIHLMHVREGRGDDHVEALTGLAGFIQRQNLSVEMHLVEQARVEASVIETAKRINADLIVIGKKNHHSFFPFLNTVLSSNIAEGTSCPVLTVKPGSLNKKLETVVMPVTELFPTRKIELLAALGNRATLNIHLLTILRNNQQPDSHTASALLQAMKSIRSRLQCQVQHSIIHSNNKAAATLRYAEKVGADILLVNPETETTISTWITKKDIADAVNPGSQLQVLSVQPK